MTKGRLTKLQCDALRTQLRDLGSQAEAEPDDRLASRFHPLREHLRFLDPAVVLVIGPRGSGKSALFRAFFENQGGVGGAVARWWPSAPASSVPFERSQWLPVYPAGTDFPDNRELAREVDSARRAQTLWYASVVRSLGGQLPENPQLSPILEPQAADLRAVLPAFEAAAAAPTLALDKLERRLEEENRWLFLGFDELETLGGPDGSATAHLIQGLVGFWSEYSRRWKRIRAKVFLRPDLFRRHARGASADFAKLAANRADLTWSETAILNMLVKRIANTSDELGDYCGRAGIRFENDPVLGRIPRNQDTGGGFRLLERMCGQHMGAGRKKGFVRNWILNHLRDGEGQVAPRTIVQLIEKAAGKDAANGNLRSPRLLHPVALRQALEDVSTNHVVQATSGEWPWLDGVRQRLKGSLVPWSREEVVAALDRDWDRSWGTSDTASNIRPPTDSPGLLVDYLVELGIFRTRSDGRLDVSDLYLYGLELTRKGGVRRSPQAGR